MSELKALIAPSLLSADFGYLARDAQSMIDAGADILHIDVMDGHFVPNISFGIPAVKGVRKHTKAFMDCHLMVSNPRQWLDVFKSIGIQGFTFHVEAVNSTEALQLLKDIKSNGIRSGIALKPKTPISSITENGIADEADMILIMTVEPGFGGQSFMADMMPKVKELRKLYPHKLIQVDGGIALDTIQIVADAGANVIVSGSGIFGSKEGPKATITGMRKVVDEAIAKYSA